MTKLQAQLESLKVNLAEKDKQIENLEEELKRCKASKLTVLDDDTVHEPEVLNCHKCEYKCKKEVTLKKHINTKHQEESHEVDLLFSNANNEKELKEANKSKLNKLNSSHCPKHVLNLKPVGPSQWLKTFKCS